MIVVISILLTLAGYSTGAVIAARVRKRVADSGLLDCGLITLAWVCEFLYFRSLPKSMAWVLEVFFASVVAGLVLQAGLYSHFRGATMGTGEFAMNEAQMLDINAGFLQRTW